MSLKVAHKGLILVSIPLLFELVSFVTLGLVVQRTEEDARREAQSRAVVAEVSNLHKAFLDAGTALVAWRFTRNSALIEKYDKSIQPIPSGFERLRAIAQGHSDQMNHISKIEDLGNKILDLLTKYGRPTAQGETGFNMTLADWSIYRKQMTHALDPFEKELSVLINEERIKQDNYQRSAAQSKSTQETLFIAFVLFSIVLTLSLAAFFSKNITQRLLVLVDNAVRVAKRQALNKQVAGGDEISLLDKEIHTMAETLRQAEERKQEFVSMINHDLRTPLTSLQGTLTLVAEGTYGDLSAQGQTRLAYAEKSLNSVINLLNQLVDIDKIEAGMLELHLESVELQTLLETAAQTVLGLAEERKVGLKVVPTAAQLKADGERLLQVMINLIGNAVKFSPKDTTVTISVEETQSHTEIRVQDQGPGIPAEYQAKIFDRFQQAPSEQDKTRPHGSGLGLAICKAIVEAHKGEIGVSSAPGGGSTFWIRIPV